MRTSLILREVQRSAPMWPGHASALEHAVREGVAADRAGVAMDLLDAVRGPLPVEIVALHDAGRAAALAGADDVDRLAPPRRTPTVICLADSG